MSDPVIEGAERYQDMQERAAEGDLLKSRFIGAILGAAVGDALGATLEFIRYEEIVKTGIRKTEVEGGGWLRLRAGETTDDTAMMRCILDSLVACGGCEPKDIAGQFVAWMQSQPKDIGNLTRSALRLIEQGASWESAGVLAWYATGGTSAGNGGLMRTIPLALAFFNDRGLDGYVEDVCKITHFDPRCVEDCVNYCRAVASILRGDDTNQLFPYVGGEPEQWNGGFTRDTFNMAAWAFHEAYDGERTFEEVLIDVVNLGGDADTTGAVVGGLLGALYGVEAIPARWLEKLEGREELTSLAEELYAQVTECRNIGEHGAGIYACQKCPSCCGAEEYCCHLPDGVRKIVEEAITG